MQYNFVQLNSLVKRLDFSKVSLPNFTPPDLKGVQVNAYNDFLQTKLTKIISAFFPIYSSSKNTEIILQEVLIKKPDITEREALEKSKSYQNVVYLKVKLTINQADNVEGQKTSEEEIFLGHMPEFSSCSNFIINGIEKFVISQIVRSSGVYVLSKSQIKLSNARKKTQEGIICELLPLKGVLMLMHLVEDKNLIKMIVRNSSGDNAPQFHVTIFFKSLGLNNQFISSIFKDEKEVLNTLTQEHYNFKDILKEEEFKSYLHDVSSAKKIEKLVDSNKNSIQQTIYKLFIDYYKKSGEKIHDLHNKLHTLTDEDAEYEKAINDLQKEISSSSDILERISCELAAKHVVNEIGISCDTTKTSVRSYQELVWSYFFDKNYYEILPAGRYKLNHKLGLFNRLYKKYIAQDIVDMSGKVVFAKGTYMDYDKIVQLRELSREDKLKIRRSIDVKAVDPGIKLHPKLVKSECEEVLIHLHGVNSPVIKVVGTKFEADEENVTLGDFLSMLSYVLHIKKKVGAYDDIDHLGNKRLRLVSELLENRIQLAMSRIQKFAIEKMNTLEARINYFATKRMTTESFFNIFTILNTKPFQIVVKEFFNSHQLTQFLDQQNLLSELTNKRKISAMGPGGIKREDPNLNIRDVHFSHYGRICPIETPEGMNIGLIFALAFYAKIDKYGFLNTPFYKVDDGKITDEVHWLNAIEENYFTTAEITSSRDKNNMLISPVVARHGENVNSIDAKEVNYIDVSCNQLVSVSASLIPFLEHDDANRALMGSNMQRQAVPLLKPHSPIVGTGVEHRIACDSEIALSAKGDGKIVAVDNKKIEIKYASDENKTDIIHLMKFDRSNQNTCKNQSPLVKLGQTIKKSDILVNGHAMQNGELALGQNLLVAFTTWHGYNFEDAIILSSKLYQEDLYTSLHIQEYTCECLRTKLGDEEITRQIPGTTSEEKKYLDEDGLIVVGAKVKEGDILVGKILPKENVDQTPEEKLLQAIFSEKARSVKDSSLKVPTGGEGIVSKIMRFSIYKGDKLNDDVIEVIKVFIIQKRKIQVGDKMAGRHGNKGIVSKIALIEDMPFLADGTPVDILLNPLGVPSRMNIGQVLESYLGLAARGLVLKKIVEFYFDGTPQETAAKIFGIFEDDVARLFKVFKNYLSENKISNIEDAKDKINQADLQVILSRAGLKHYDVDLKVLSPIFTGCNNEDLIEILKEADLDPTHNNGKLELYDGKTGERFKHNIAIGVIYMLKLDHMVDDKIYSRSVGPYSKITQQPLGGKCQNGGQRFGEMEVWAMEAYGAAYNLQELLTIKSDDVYSRNSIYCSIVKGQKLPTPNIPESFKLLVKKLQAVGLKINVKYGDKKELISCHEFIEKQLNRHSDFVYDSDYQENLADQLTSLVEETGSEDSTGVKSNIIEDNNADDLSSDDGKDEKQNDSSEGESK